MLCIDCARALVSHGPGSPDHRRYFRREALRDKPHSIRSIVIWCEPIRIAYTAASLDK